MGVVAFNVPLVTQASNPICWVACMAMVDSYFNGQSIGIGTYVNGFDPSNSSIPNPAIDMPSVYRRLHRCGFDTVKVNPKVADLEAALSGYGPLILAHYCQGFPYGSEWAAVTQPEAKHAVVLTGMDTESLICWINNPWGDLDRVVSVSAVIYAMKRMLSQGMRPLIAQTS